MGRTKQTARKSTGGMVPRPTVRQRVARKSVGRGVERPQNPNELTEIRTNLEDFGTIDQSEPVELPHGARDVRCTVDSATAFFDISLSDLSDFNDTEGRLARHQISEPFTIAGLWWVLGIEKKILFTSSRSKVVAQLFCISLQHRLSPNSLLTYPLRFKIHRGDNVFCAETGQAFDMSPGLVQVSGSFAFSMETGSVRGTSSVVEFGGQPLVLHGASHQPICGIVLDSVSDHVCGGDVIVLTVKFMGNPPVRVRVVSESGQGGDNGDGKEPEGSESSSKKSRI